MRASKVVALVLGPVVLAIGCQAISGLTDLEREEQLTPEAPPDLGRVDADEERADLGGEPSVPEVAGEAAAEADVADAAEVDDGAAEVSDAQDASDTGDADASDGAVPCTETNAKRLRGHCYFLTTGTYSFEQARTACISRGAHLVTITAADEQELVATIGSTEERWIGLRRESTAPALVKGSFQWVTGESSSFDGWEPTEPDGSGECVRIRPPESRWADRACSGTGSGTPALRAICERE